jgi:hypothetical protein
MKSSAHAGKLSKVLILVKKESTSPQVVNHNVDKPVDRIRK